jgi:cyclase
MPKIRVMPTLLFKEVGLVKGIGFDSWRRVGSAIQAVKVYNMREVDELVFLDITATREGRPPDFEAVDELADE